MFGPRIPQVSRSKHTRPRSIRAADRIRDPREPRGADDPTRLHAVRRQLKQLGISLGPEQAPAKPDWPLPRIIAKRARRGFHHPADKVAIATTLRFFGEPCCYGLRVIELRQGDPKAPGLQFGRLLAPGRVLLYDQLPSPWRLPGLVDDDHARLLRAGAEVEQLGPAAVLVHWPTTALRDFMRLDVLMHEIGHHLLQHHKGKREVRIARTGDHESFADNFARRCRQLYEQRPGDGPETETT